MFKAGILVANGRWHLTRCTLMDRLEFWKAIEDARGRASGDTDAVAAHATAILAALPREQIAGAAQPL